MPSRLSKNDDLQDEMAAALEAIPVLQDAVVQLQAAVTALQETVQTTGVAPSTQTASTPVPDISALTEQMAGIDTRTKALEVAVFPPKGVAPAATDTTAVATDPVVAQQTADQSSTTADQGAATDTQAATDQSTGA